MHAMYYYVQAVMAR